MMIPIRKALRKIKPFQKLKWKADFLVWKARVNRQSKYTSTFYDVYKTYWIDPARIKQSIRPGHLDGPEVVHEGLNEIGRIDDGSWDLQTIPFESLDVFQSFKRHFEDGKDWKKTALYARGAGYIQSGRSRWDCSTLEELEKRLHGFDRMFREIKEIGYRSKDELHTSNMYGKEDEIMVHIGRDGDYIFANGRHRLSLAKIAKVREVPVKVGRRHKDWVMFRCEILEYANGRSGKNVYQPLAHPDLSDIPSSHGWTRWKVIEPHVPRSGGTLLDVGAHWGFFSHCFEELGFDCTAVERMPNDVYFLSKLCRAENRRFKVVESNIFDVRLEREYDIVIALNIFHHFLKEKELYENLISFLESLKTRIMFFQPHLVDEQQMQNSYKNYSEKEFVEFIQSKARLPKVTLLGQDDDGRSIYKIER